LVCAVVLHRHQLAVAHDGRAVGDGHHFVEAVRYIEHRHALAAQFAQHAEHALHVAHRQAGRGFVEHQQARLALRARGRWRATISRPA
jgi:hypothetical protein